MIGCREMRTLATNLVYSNYQDSYARNKTGIIPFAQGSRGRKLLVRTLIHFVQHVVMTENKSLSNIFLAFFAWQVVILVAFS